MMLSPRTHYLLYAAVVIFLVAAAAATRTALSPNSSISNFGRSRSSRTSIRSCFAHADPTVTTSSRRRQRRRRQRLHYPSWSVSSSFNPRPSISILSLTSSTTTVDVVVPEEERTTTKDDSNRNEESDAERKEKDDNNDDEKEEEEEEEEEEEGKKRMISIHTYRRKYNPIDGNTSNTAAVKNHNNNNDATEESATILMGIGMPKQQFASFVNYCLTHMTFDGEVKSRDGDMLAIEESAAAIAATTSDDRTRKEENMRLVIDDILQHVTTQELDWDADDTENEVDGGKLLHFDEQRKMIREYWKAGKLICESTSLLSSTGRRRRNQNNDSSSSGKDDCDELDPQNDEAALRVKKERDEAEEERQYKLERLRETLQSWAERLTSFVKDELSELDNNAATEADSDMIISSCGLRRFIENEYGHENTRLLLAQTLLQQTEAEQLQIFQSFLNWFRSTFPYYHDRCDSCGTSCKQDPPIPGVSSITDDVQSRIDAITAVNDVSTDTGNDVGDSLDVGEKDVKEEDEYSFLGYLYPTNIERQCGDASRTELYRCRSCLSYTRFPRYNNAMSVIETKRGRCGEYSMLLYRILRVLGYREIRWVVDWSDHVWVEVYLGVKIYNNADSQLKLDDDNVNGRWVHLDPCEAAVDNPLLYESWGKNQTYIVAYHDPFFGNWRGSRGDSDKLIEDKREIPGRRKYPPVEDVTRQYTSDESNVIEDRRGIDNVSVAEAVNDVSKNLVDMLKKLTQRIESQV